MYKSTDQYYPTYHFDSKNKEVVLIEFEEAQKIANTQTKVYGQVANILLAIMTFLIPLFFSKDETNIKVLESLKANRISFALILAIFGALLLRYFVDLQRQITVNARKVVTLRSMLGLKYGTLHLTLPKHRVEGASNPFAIKYFDGWLKFQSMPFWVLTIGVNLIWWLATKDERIWFEWQLQVYYLPWYLGNFLITVIYFVVFRRNLNDQHETIYLNLVRLLAKSFRFKLLDDFEYILYRAKLEVVETSRLDVEYVNLKKMIVEIEDRGFYVNDGVSLKSILRAFGSQIPYLRRRYGLIKSGGSTITMQLVRTLLIPSNQNRYLRKFFEILLAYWFRNQFGKKEILELYVSSVRYDYGIMGLTQALHHFWGSVKKKKLTVEESFFLTERLSNVTGTYRPERISLLLQKTTATIDEIKLTRLYNELIERGKIHRSKK